MEIIKPATKNKIDLKKEWNVNNKRPQKIKLKVKKK
jgi:hypothetical protein